MVLRNIFLSVLFIIPLLYSVIAQGVPGNSTPPVCSNPNDFPLFGSTCISREAYTAIFLTSIILAGISFLMLMGLLIAYCIRRSSKSRSIYTSDTRSSASSVDSVPASSIMETPRINRRNQEKTAVLGKVTGRTPLEDTTQRRNNPPSNDYYLAAEKKTSPSTTSAPYTVTKPVSKQTGRTTTTKTTVVTHKQSGIHEMTPQLNTRLPTNSSRTEPSAQPPIATRQDGRGGRNRNNNPPIDDDKVSSQF